MKHFIRQRLDTLWILQSPARMGPPPKDAASTINEEFVL